MINFSQHRLSNGLRLLIHENHDTQLAAVNLLYDVGARDEEPDRTGFAHLFEHLMFGGSANIADYDAITQQIGAENNAFTNNDITNYYLSFPANNLETAFWLESDRMKQLDFSTRSLDVQRQVVIEEFKQRYLNQPYGDAWLKLRPLVYKKHPYQWATIGKNIEHIENATLEDVEAFFYKHYRPNNCILSVAGRVNTKEVVKLAEKWFGDIPAGDRPVRNLPQEDPQTEARSLHLHADVPVDAFYLAFPMPGRLHPDYIACDMLSDILSRGKSARLYRSLVKEKKYCSQIQAYVSGDQDPGMFVVSGRLVKGITHEQAINAVFEEFKLLQEQQLNSEEMQKLYNNIESTLRFGETQILNVAMNLGYYALLGDANGINLELARYRAVDAADLQKQAQQLFQHQQSNTLYYHAE